MRGISQNTKRIIITSVTTRAVSLAAQSIRVPGQDKRAHSMQENKFCIKENTSWVLYPGYHGSLQAMSGGSQGDFGLCSKNGKKFLIHK